MLLKILKRAVRSLVQKSEPGPAPVPAGDLPSADLGGLLERAGLSHRAGNLDEAYRAYESAFRLLPEAELQSRAAVLVNMAAILREQERLPQAIAYLREALFLRPGLAVAHYNLGLNLYETGDSGEAERCLKSAIEIDPDFQAAHSTLLCLYGLARSEDPLRVLAEHRRWAERYADPLTLAAAPHANERSLERRLTIGYVSADFKDHSVARFISPILANHDRTRFRVICYDNWPKGDATTARLRAFADDWRKIDTLDDRQAAELVRADGVDILVDLSGHTTGNRLLMFARKPAPVQASWLGYMCTTGMRAFDWRITDAYLDPPGTSETFYVERLARIASTAAFEPHPDSPAVSALPALANGFVRFGSFNNYAKIGDGVIALWGRLLAALPQSRLLIVALGGDDPHIQAGVRARFDSLAASTGVSQRVDVMGRRSQKGFLNLFAQVDIALDPFPYGGGTTSLHTLWMGVAIVTLEGNTEISRSTSGMLIACGADELVARSESEYLEIGIRLAGDLPRLCGFRESLRRRFSEIVLCNGPLVTRSLEEAYRRMWADYVDASR